MSFKDIVCDNDSFESLVQKNVKNIDDIYIFMIRSEHCEYCDLQEADLISLKKDYFKRALHLFRIHISTPSNKEFIEKNKEKYNLKYMPSIYVWKYGIGTFMPGYQSLEKLGNFILLTNKACISCARRGRKVFEIVDGIKTLTRIGCKKLKIEMFIQDDCEDWKRHPKVFKLEQS